MPTWRGGSVRPRVTCRQLPHSWRFEGKGASLAIRSVGVRSMRDRNGGGMLVPARDGARVLAWLHLRGYAVEETL